MGSRASRSARARACDAAVDTSNPALPVAGTGNLKHVRGSTNAKWRATVLILLHLVIGAHITHYLVSGRTLSPVEPSESMYTLELGELNAGFIFFLVTLAATLVFGRFVCGWGCHIVALQDLCGWLMKRMGVRPRPFRSRLLVFVPLGLALYMFVWPTVRRLLFEPPGSFPGFSNHMVTDSFWKTFPGPLFTVLTLATCGFAAVYFLGAKGFCTYGCPYGAFYGLVSGFAPGNIVVSDACEQCGHCTATCTSNVRVHEEVRLYGQVVDPGCMKCLDCVTVCPKGALSYGFSKPSRFRGRPAGVPRDPRPVLGLGQEAALLAICVAAALAFRGLYDGPPLLMATGLGGITAFLALKLWQLWRRPTVRLQNLQLKRSGALGRGGKLFALLALAWLGFAAHSGFVQWHRVRGRSQLEQTEASRADVLSGAFAGIVYSARHERTAAATMRHFRLADSWGLFDVAEVKLGLAWGHMLRDEVDEAVAAVERALTLQPDQPNTRDDLVHLLASRGRLSQAVTVLEEKIERSGAQAQDLFTLGGLLVATGSRERALAAFEQSIELAPDIPDSHYNLGGLLRRMGRPAEAVEQLKIAAQLAPGDPDTQVELGLAHAEVGDKLAAISCLRRAIELAPDRSESRMHLSELIRQLEDSP